MLAATIKIFGSAGGEALFTPANTGSPLNPHNIAAIPRTTNVADATTFIDAAPGRSRVEAAPQAARRFVGPRQPISPRRRGVPAAESPAVARHHGRTDHRKWGTGYAWNPTGFISPQKNPTDPNDRRSVIRGVDAIKADVFVRGTSVSLYAMQHQTFAARVYRLVGEHRRLAALLPQSRGDVAGDQRGARFRRRAGAARRDRAAHARSSARSTRSRAT